MSFKYFFKFLIISLLFVGLIPIYGYSDDLLTFKPTFGYGLRYSSLNKSDQIYQVGFIFLNQKHINSSINIEDGRILDKSSSGSNNLNCEINIFPLGNRFALIEHNFFRDIFTGRYLPTYYFLRPAFFYQTYESIHQYGISFEPIGDPTAYLFSPSLILRLKFGRTDTRSLKYDFLEVFYSFII
jgi:hypothetical protein